jgi:hypothetical protein
MGVLDDVVAKVTDPYERKARLYPALLALLPLVVMVALVYGAKASVVESAVAAAVSCGALYLVTNLCRELGKRLEPKLFLEWGGKPSTQLLRHRDNTIEGPTKKRYHAFLGAKINEVFPDAEQEVSDPGGADDIYQSGVRWLLNHTRPDDTKKFDLLFKENVAYGFRRNALGIKPLALVVSVGCAVWTLARENAFVVRVPFIHGAALTRLPETSMVSLIVSVGVALIWIFFFTKASVRSVALSYAEMLLRACDAL